MSRLDGVEVFVEVVESGSFSKAAKRMNLSKSAVSKQVKRLEDRLSVQLLNRTTRRIHLTEVGREFYERCVSILSEAERAELAIGRFQDVPRGTLRINAPVSFGTTYLAPAIAEFLETYPDLVVDLTLNDHLVDIVKEGFDVVIRISQLSDSSMIARRLASSQAFTCATPEYLDKHGRPHHPNDLRSHRCGA
ncbi:MAG: LysR family transcriptional regulator [Myxococcales bacterium]|nr:LysR family transcriptional regulator [Myxococcales bacterium]